MLDRKRASIIWPLRCDVVDRAKTLI